MPPATPPDRSADHWLHRLSRAARDELLAAPIRLVPSGRAPLIIEGQPAGEVLLIETGLVAVTQYGPDGEQVFLAFRGPGDLVGEFAALQEQPRAATVSVATGQQRRLRVRAYPVAGFRAFLARHPDADQAVRRAALAKLTTDQARQTSYRGGPVPQRVARVLLDQLTDHGRTAADGDLVIVAPLTEARIADLILLRPRVVRQTLAELAGKGLIARRRTATGLLRVLDLEGLRQVAGVLLH